MFLYLCKKNDMGNVKDILFIAKSKGYYTDKNGNIFSVNKKISLRKAQERYNFTIRYYGKRVTISVHKFIAYLKYGDEIFNEGIEVRHLDGNSLNNVWDNIAIGTHSENMMDIPEKNRIKKAINASNKVRRFSDDEVKEILFNKEAGMSYNKLCIKYNTSKSTLSYLFNKAYYRSIINI